MLKNTTLFFLAMLSTSTLFAQNMPSEMRFSADGKRLILGNNQTTGLYDDTEIKVVELEFNQPNYWNLLGEDTPATLSFEGNTYNEVGVRFKGATSDFANDTQKKSFNVSLDFTDETQDIEGYQTLNFNGGFEDPSNMREILYNWIGRHYNPSLKTSFIHLKINGETWGAYSNVQQLNKDFLKEWFLNNDGSRFRCINSDWEYNPGLPVGPCYGDIGGGDENGWGGGPSSLNWLGSDTLLYQENYWLKGTERADPWSELVTSIDKLNNLPLEQLADSLPQYFNIDKTLWYLAHETLFTDDDSYVYKGQMDYYVYFDDALEVLIPLEYDGNSAMQSYFTDWSPFHREDDECLPLVNRLMMVPEFRQRYAAHCRTIIKDYMDIDLIHAKIDEYAALINDLEANDPVGDQLFSYNQYLSGVQELKEFFVGRRNFLMANEELNQVGLSISNVEYTVNGLANQQPSNTDNVVVNANISDGNVQNIYLHYGEGFMGDFDKVEMFDDGQHGDGAANDGVYGATIPPFASGKYVRYYIEAVKADNYGTRSYEPVGAEHDVYIYQVQAGQMVASDAVINEIMASNKETQADQDGEFDDWIELYNNSNTVIDLAGYFLSDDATNLMKWEIPQGTFLEADGYLIIWADNDEEQDGLHANFKLAKSGETIYLVTPDGNIADQVAYGEQETDRSLARTPNGTGDFVIKNSTFNANNDTSVHTNEVEKTVTQLKVSPNPASQEVLIDFTATDTNSKDLRVFNILGMPVWQGKISGKTQMDISDWESGIYIITVEQEIVRLVVN